MVWSRSSVRGSVVMSVSTGCARSTRPATIRAKMSRSVRTPTSRPDWSHTKTESPVPVRWIARRHSASDVAGGTVTGWRRLSTRRRSSRMAGTRRATAVSVRSVTLRSVATVAGTGVSQHDAPDARRRTPGASEGATHATRTARHAPMAALAIVVARGRGRMRRPERDADPGPHAGPDRPDRGADAEPRQPVDVTADFVRIIAAPDFSATADVNGTVMVGAAARPTSPGTPSSPARLERRHLSDHGRRRSPGDRVGGDRDEAVGPQDAGTVAGGPGRRPVGGVDVGDPRDHRLGQGPRGRGEGRPAAPPPPAERRRRRSRRRAIGFDVEGATDAGTRHGLLRDRRRDARRS